MTGIILPKFLSGMLDGIQEKNLYNQLDLSRIPTHLGLILDGNRRFAVKYNLARKYGHKMGINTFREVLDWCDEFRIKYVTIWVFSNENWDRDKTEIDDITQLFLAEAREQLETKTFLKRGIRFRAIGEYAKFGKPLSTLLSTLEKQTSQCTHMTLNVAIGYGGQQEILKATNTFIKKNPGKQITADSLRQNSYLPDQPAPDLIIRTSGEHRHSGFLLWHCAYSEYFFSTKFWPAFGRVDFLKALTDYQARKRRFGK